jgi:CubicO group peptidase (beta-lactamase class C family)
MRRPFRLVASVVVVLSAAGALLQGITSPAWGQDVGEKADQYLSTWAKQGRFSGAVLIAKGDKILLRKGYGMANYELNVPNSPEMVFRIGSITKSFTGLAVLQLEEKGLLKVSDPVAKYVPEMPEGWNAITIHDLLCHKSGIPDFTSTTAYRDFSDNRHVENALKESADKPLVNKPGEVLHYSNSGYILLGRVIEKVSGKSYEEYLNENILKPAGMTHTAYDHAADVVQERASGYRFDGETIVNAAYNDPAHPAAAGSLRSTVDDMYRLDRALKAGKLFSPALTAKAWTGYGHWTAPPPFPMEAEYGYGWMLGDEFGHKYVGHGGWVNGFVSQFTRFTDDDEVLIILWNIETANNFSVSKDLAAIMFGQKYELPVARPIVHPAPEKLARYVGDYQVGPLTLQITMHDGKLYAFGGQGQPVPYGLIAVSDTEFYCNDTPTIITFMPDQSGNTNQVVIKLGDQVIPANRLAAQQKPGN